MLSDLDTDQRLQLLRFVCSFAWADLEIRDEERDYVTKMINRLELDESERAEVMQWLKLPPRPEEVDPTTIPHEHRELFVRAMEAVVATDRNVSEEERENLVLFRNLTAP